MLPNAPSAHPDAVILRYGYLQFQFQEAQQILDEHLYATSDVLFFHHSDAAFLRQMYEYDCFDMLMDSLYIHF